MNAYFGDVIFRPLLAMLEDAGVKPNAKYQAQRYSQTGRNNTAFETVQEALKSGRIHYADGVFTGVFSAAITRELKAAGAVFSASQKAFLLKPGEMPYVIRSAVEASLDASRSLHGNIAAMLTEMQGNVQAAQTGLNLAKRVDAIVDDLQKQLVQTVEVVGDLAVPADITPAIRKRLTEELTENLDLGIKDFSEKEIPELRALVEDNAFAGFRTDRLAKIIEARYGVTKRKAAFLADQETGLLVSKFREGRYREIGAVDYVWSTSHDARVRPSHRALDGKSFSWDSPPLVSEPGQPARKCNPGEDYRCRCVAMPVINLEALAAA